VTLTPEERAYLHNQPLGRLATVDAQGAPQNNPVGFNVNDDGTIDIGGRAMASTRKWRNIHTNAAVALVVDDLQSVNPWTVRGVEIRGTAEPTIIATQPGDYMSPDIIRLRPQRIISWGLDPERPGMTSRPTNA
jgi:pyridoxamine 5'-phosphate oxidase family protein